MRTNKPVETRNISPISSGSPQAYPYAYPSTRKIHFVTEGITYDGWVIEKLYPYIAVGKKGSRTRIFTIGDFVEMGIEPITEDPGLIYQTMARSPENRDLYNEIGGRLFKRRRI